MRFLSSLTGRGADNETPSTWHFSDSSDSTLDCRPVDEQFPRSHSEQLARLKDSRRAWVVCLAAFVIQVLDVGVLHVFGVFFVALVDEFQSSKATVAWIGSLAYGLTMLLAVLASTLINRFGARPVAMTGSVICCFSLLISSFAPSIEVLFGTFSVMYGLGTSLAYTPTMCIADDYFTKYVSLATGIMTAGSSTGTLILSPIAQALVSSVGWRNAFRTFSGVLLICIWSGWMFKPLLPADPEPEPDTTSAKLQRITITRRLVQELQLWKNKVYTIYVVSVTLCMFGYYIPYVHLVSHVKSLGMTSQQGSNLVMTLGAATAVGRMMFGKIIEWGYLNRVHMHQVSMVITGSGCLLLPAITNYPGLVCYVIGVGLVDGCYVVLLPVLTTQLAGLENRVMAWGFLVAMSSVTFTLGPPVAGMISDMSGSYSLAFRIASAPIIGGALILFLIPWAQKTARSTNIMEAAKADEETEEADGEDEDLGENMMKIVTRNSCVIIDINKQSVVSCRPRTTSESTEAGVSASLPPGMSHLSRPEHSRPDTAHPGGQRRSRRRSYSESAQEPSRLPEDVLQAISVLRKHSENLQQKLTASDTGILDRFGVFGKTSEQGFNGMPASVSGFPGSYHGIGGTGNRTISTGSSLVPESQTASHGPWPNSSVDYDDRSSLPIDPYSDQTSFSPYLPGPAQVNPSLPSTEPSLSSLQEEPCEGAVVGEEDIELAIFSSPSTSPRDSVPLYVNGAPCLPTVREESAPPSVHPQGDESSDRSASDASSIDSQIYVNVTSDVTSRGASDKHTAPPDS